MRSTALVCLNDSKYGYDSKDNVLRLSLLRSPEWPDPHADEGHHEFIYSLYLHSGTWREAQTLHQGYQLNYPLIAVTRDSTRAPASQQVVLRRAGRQRGHLRYQEGRGRRFADRALLRVGRQKGRNSHHVAPDRGSATETNLMEKPDQPLSMASNGTVVVVPTNPYEIKTVKVAFGK